MLFFDLTPYNIAVYFKARHKLNAERRAAAKREKLVAEEENEEEEYPSENEFPVPAFKERAKREKSMALILKLLGVEI